MVTMEKHDTHTHTIVLRLFWILSETAWMSQYQKGKNQEGKTNLDLLEQEIVSGSGICWVICKYPVCTSPQRDNHTTPTLVRCPSCHPTSSVKPLKAMQKYDIKHTTHTQPFYCWSGICPGPPGSAGTRKVKPRRLKPIWIYWSKR